MTSMVSRREPRVEMRDATAGDYDGIMAASEGIYGGEDYLPCRFHGFLSDPLRVCFVCVQDGVVAGFIMSFVVDEGTTYIEKAARVHPKFRGQGHYRRMQDFAKQETFRRTPTLKRIVWASAEFDLYQEKILTGQIPAKIITRRERIKLKMTTDTLQDLNKDIIRSGRKDTTTFENAADIEHLIMANSDNSSIFPNDLAVVNWNPYRLLPRNATIISKEVNIAAGATCNGCVRSISFSQIERYMTECVGFIIDFHGDNGDDVISHLCSGLAFIADHVESGKQIVIKLWLPGYVDMTPAIGFIKDELGIPTIESRDLQLSVFEMPFQI